MRRPERRPAAALFALATLVPLTPGPAWAEEWYEAYRDGLQALSRGQAARAATHFERAAARRSEPGENLLTYGTNVLKSYHPYLKLAEAQILAGMLEAAADTLERSEKVGREPAAERAELESRLASARAARATPLPAATPEPSPTAVSTPTPTPSPTPIPTPEPTPTPRAAPSPAPSPRLPERPTPTPTPAPALAPSLVNPTPTPATGDSDADASSTGPAAAATGSLEVLSSPPGARVYLDDALVGTTDPVFGRLVVPDLGAGAHALRVSSEGHDDVRRSVTIAAGQTTIQREQLPSRGVSTSAIAFGFFVIAVIALALVGVQRSTTRPAATTDPNVTRRLEHEDPAASSATAVSGAPTAIKPATPKGPATPSTPESDFPLEFGDFDLVGLLGRGGMAIVYRAERNDEEFALKRPRAGFLDDPQFRERFEREAEIGRTLHHPNVIRIHENGKVGDVPYFTMELVAGETVQERLKREGPIPARPAVETVVQITEALDYAHNKGVIHRDLKPSNIMVLRDGTAKVMDYGIAKAQRFEGLTVTGAFLGTPEYVPPEVVEGTKADARSDLYSLGIVFYEMVTGERPFRGDSPFQVLRMQTTDTPKPPTTLTSNLPPELEEIILRLMAKDPSERYPDAEALVIALRDFQNRA